MKTDDLIRAVVADNQSLQRPISRTIAIALLIGTLIATAVFATTLGARSDFAFSITNSWRFVLKFAVTLGLALPALLIVRRMARPDDAAGGLTWLLALPVVLLISGVAVEMVEVPRDHWAVYAVGMNWYKCMVLIPLLSIAPLALILYALRQGAPSHPMLAGAAGGLLAAGIAATLYASHCADDSPMFVSLWYTIGIAVVTGVGAFLGQRLLKW